MAYNDMPVIIPLLATGYLLTIYLLLILAQWTMKSSRYAANSLSDAYAPYLSTEDASQKDEVERWSLRNITVIAPSLKREFVTPKEILPELMISELTSPNAALVSSSEVTISSTVNDSIHLSKVQETSSVG